MLFSSSSFWMILFPLISFLQVAQTVLDRIVVFWWKVFLQLLLCKPCKVIYTVARLDLASKDACFHKEHLKITCPVRFFSLSFGDFYKRRTTNLLSLCIVLSARCFPVKADGLSAYKPYIHVWSTVVLEVTFSCLYIAVMELAKVQVDMSYGFLFVFTSCKYSLDSSWPWGKIQRSPPSDWRTTR